MSMIWPLKLAPVLACKSHNSLNDSDIYTSDYDSICFTIEVIAQKSEVVGCRGVAITDFSSDLDESKNRSQE